MPLGAAVTARGMASLSPAVLTHPASDAKRVKLEHEPKEETSTDPAEAQHKAESDQAAGTAAAADLQDDFAWEDM